MQIPLHTLRTNGFHVILFGIVIVATWLRLRNLSVDSLWFDEAASWMQARGTLAELVSKTAQDNYPPLHNLLLFVFMKVSGQDTEWVLRLPSALLGIANILAVYWLGAVIGGRVVGLFAAALLAVSGFHIYYSQEARMYSLLALAATLYAATAFFFAQFPTTYRAILLAVSGLALVYSHPFGTLNWLTIALVISGYIFFTANFSWLVIIKWIAANAVIVIGFVPWAVILLQRSHEISGNFWIPYPTASYVHNQLKGLYGGTLAGVALLLSAAVAFWYNLRASVVLLVWIIGPIVAALILSVAHTPILFGRYLIPVIPALAVLGALGMAKLASTPRWSMKIVAAALFITAAIPNLNTTLWKRNDWRSIADYIGGHLQNEGCVLVYPAYQETALRYYLRSPFCAVRVGAIAEVDLQTIPTDQLFVVLATGSHNTPNVRLLKKKMNAFGRKGQSRHVQSFFIIEYKRER